MSPTNIRAALYLFHVQKMDTTQIAARFGERESTIANAFAKNSGMRREFLKEGCGEHGG